MFIYCSTFTTSSVTQGAEQQNNKSNFYDRKPEEKAKATNKNVKFEYVLNPVQKSGLGHGKLLQQEGSFTPDLSLEKGPFRKASPGLGLVRTGATDF